MQMSFQGTYVVADLDLAKTYENLGKFSNIISKCSDIVKGNFDFLLNIDEEEAHVQISKGSVNIWHSKEYYVYEAAEKLKPLVINADGEKCKGWILKYMQKIGSSKISRSLTEEVGLPAKVEEADYDEVFIHVQAMKKVEDPDVLLFRLKRLDKLARSKRIAHLPIVPFFEEALKDLKYQQKKVLARLIGILSPILGIEHHHKMAKYRMIVESIQDGLLNRIIKIAENEIDQEVLLSIIYFLKVTDRKDSVNALFRMVERMSDELYSNLKGFIWDALFREDSVLKKTQSKLIDKKIEELLNHQDPRIRKRAKELSERAY